MKEQRSEKVKEQRSEKVKEQRREKVKEQHSESALYCQAAPAPLCDTQQQNSTGK